MLKSILMAASWLSSSLIPAPPRAIMTGTSQRPVRECGERRADADATILCNSRRVVAGDRACASERAADRERGDVAWTRRGAPSGRGVGVGDIAALHLGVDAAHNAFGNRVRRR